MNRELLLWRAGAAIICGLVVLGGLQALLWSRIAPGEQFFVNTDGSFGGLPTESYHQFSSIAIFVLIELVVGLAAAALVWQWRSIRGTATLLVLVGASGLGALTAYLLGRVLASGTDPASVGNAAAASIVNAAPTLGNAMVIIAQPAVAAAVYTFLVAWTGRPDLSRPEPAAPAAVVSGPTGIPDWSAAVTHPQPVQAQAWSVDPGSADRGSADRP